MTAWDLLPTSYFIPVMQRCPVFVGEICVSG